MQPQYISLAAIFGPQARYTVPLFQRPYVWKKAEQWEPLWDDVEALADRVLAAERGEAVAGHFLGTAVLEQTLNATGSLPSREIIDGQQRLTTLQLLLKAAAHALEQVRDGFDMGAPDRKPFDVGARQIGFLTANPAFSDEDEKYKVWPTNQDREAFRNVMDAPSSAEAPKEGTRMAEAYGFFFDRVTGWLGSADSEQRASSLAAALKDHLKLIVLDLDDADEPQAIFETLNAHGTPLLPADLIKNWLIWEATRQGKNAAALYEKWWKPFDQDAEFWRATIGSGHAARARIDTFLLNWLTRQTRMPVPPKHLYDRFLKYVGARAASAGGTACDVESVLTDIFDDALRYRRIDAPVGWSRFDIFLRRLKVFDFVVFQPVLLALMGRPGTDETDLGRIATAFESWLLRRMVCEEQTRGYGTFAITLLDAIAGLDENSPAADVVISELKNPKALGTPDDDRFRQAWCGKQFYRYFRRDRVLLILRAIEEHYMTASALGEPIVAFNYEALQIEHILPQSWEANWPIQPDGDRALREHRVHAIGNLTLVSDKLNPTLSNAAWLDQPRKERPTLRGKRTEFGHSNLAMNSRLVATYPEKWDESSIDARALELFDIARIIWPAL